jgi:glutamate N-acetyltransferase/amino-acid N-acetyltransferase
MKRRSGVTKPIGFMAGGIDCGIKKDKTKDLALIVSDRPAKAWGVFTTNNIKGAPVIISKEHLRSPFARGIVVNSGNANTANTFTIKAVDHAIRMTKAVAISLGCEPRSIFVASTGVIGKPLPISKIERGIAKLSGEISVYGGADAAEAIMTTDLVIKESHASFKIGSKKVTVGGCSKGSGMIHPNMATMLAFVTMDAAVSRSVLKDIVKRANEDSFNKITVDGDTSTSDMFIALANGASGAPLIEKPRGKRYSLLLDKVTLVCVDLAKAVVRDGEGATKFVTVNVTGARSEKDAILIAKSIAKSSLVKTAMFGQDANWGRILCAAGYAGPPIDASKITIKLCGVTAFKQGSLPKDFEARVKPMMKKSNITISLDLGAGKATAQVWTCDMSYDYIRINTDYRS